MESTGQEPAKGRWDWHARGRLTPAGPFGLLFAAAAFLLAWDLGNHAPLTMALVSVIGFDGLVAGAVTGLAGALLGKLLHKEDRRPDVVSAQIVLAHAQHESFWKASPDSFYRIEVRPDGRLIVSGLNPAYERLTGLHEREVVGRSPEECLPWEGGLGGMAKWRECLAGGQPIIYQERLALPTGLRHCRTSLVPVRDVARGQVALIIGSVADITTDKNAELELTRVNAQLRSILCSVSDCYCTLDHEFRLTGANDAALEWLGLDEGSAIGTSFRHFFTPGTPHGRAMQRAIETQGPVHDELPSLSRPGRWLDYRIYPAPGGVSLFFRDITEARASREAVRQMSRQILASQEDERRRIACELHDSTAQHVVAATLNLMLLPGPRNEAERQVREDIQTSLSVALQEIRIFTYLLHPPGLRRNGLLKTLESFLDGFGSRAGLATSLCARRTLDELPEDLQHAVFRVVQEALSNVHKHAHASRVKVCAKLTKGSLFLRVTDDGVGMPRATGTALDLEDGPVGVGLPGMRARLRQFGGDLRVRSKPGRTTLLATVPLERNVENLLSAA